MANPAHFRHSAKQGNLSLEDMLLTFNNGLGMVLAVAPDAVNAMMQQFNTHDEPAYIIGNYNHARLQTLNGRGKHHGQ
ncbi:Phosphoribosylformylglycinamidine cyclo-ligase [Weissella viridescens]|uniref:Phosphoribosylformylglycinamidine cyclo-ligase n=1 Tax=Weissella viridescens TaxID=1629 RepID=A0A380P134_WEIVI|nr:Phosphoribosylformylglycinamidine cyclo-ligase [Weissella viridescens]